MPELYQTKQEKKNTVWHKVLLVWGINTETIQCIKERRRQENNIR